MNENLSPISRRAVLLFLTVTVAACAGPVVDEIRPASGLDPASAVYRLAPGDRLRINTFGHADVSGEFEIDAAGFIVFPLLGQIRAGGQAVDALTRDMTAELDRRFIVDPNLSIDVLNFRPFFILGQVNRPDSYPYRSGLTVRQAVALAGGFTRRAKTGIVTIVRQADDGPQEFRASIDAGLLPGDTVEVSRRLF